MNEFNIASGNNFERSMEKNVSKHLEEFITIMKQHGFTEDKTYQTNLISSITEFCMVHLYVISGVLELAHAGSQELLVHISSQ